MVISNYRRANPTLYRSKAITSRSIPYGKNSQIRRWSLSQWVQLMHVNLNFATRFFIKCACYLSWVFHVHWSGWIHFGQHWSILLPRIGRGVAGIDIISYTLDSASVYQKVKPKISAVSPYNNRWRPYWSFPLIKIMLQKTLPVYFSAFVY